MSRNNTKNMKPIDAFVAYVNEVKPYHSKLLEIVESYRFYENIDVSFKESTNVKVSYKPKPLCQAVGFGLVYDECGFSNDECCDLFQCVGGYGVIWDNSDLVAEYPIVSVTDNEELIIAGNVTRDLRLPILKITGNEVHVSGNWLTTLQDHKIFLIAQFNVYTIQSNDTTSIVIAGNVERELNTKKEIRLTGTRYDNGLYGVQNATYDPTEHLTTVVVAGDKELLNDLTGGFLETEASPKNQGYFSVKSLALVDGNTIIRTVEAFDFNTTKECGSVQLRTGLSSPREIWVAGTTDEQSYIIVDSYYNTADDQTHVVVSSPLYGVDNQYIRIYGYMTGAGFDGAEECQPPKPTNIHTYISEKLSIHVVNLNPYFTSQPVIQVTEGELYEYNITTGDQRNRSRVVSAPLLPAWLTLTTGPNGTATLTGTPDWESLRSYEVHLLVENDVGLFGTQRFTIAVIDAIPDLILASAGDDKTQICDDLVLLSPELIGFGVPGEFNDHTYLWEQIDDSTERLNIVNANQREAHYIGTMEHVIRFWLNKGTPKEQYKDVNIYKTPVTKIQQASKKSSSVIDKNYSAGQRTSLGHLTQHTISSAYTNPEDELKFGLSLDENDNPIVLYWNRPVNYSDIIGYRVERYSGSSRAWETVSELDKNAHFYSGPGIAVGDVVRLVTLYRDTVGYKTRYQYSGSRVLITDSRFNYESVSDSVHVLGTGSATSPTAIIVTTTQPSGKSGAGIAPSEMISYSLNLVNLISESANTTADVSGNGASVGETTETGYSTNLPSLINIPEMLNSVVGNMAKSGHAGEAVQVTWSTNLPGSTTIGQQ